MMTGMMMALLLTISDGIIRIVMANFISNGIDRQWWQSDNDLMKEN